MDIEYFRRHGFAGVPGPGQQGARRELRQQAPASRSARGRAARHGRLGETWRQGIGRDADQRPPGVLAVDRAPTARKETWNPGPHPLDHTTTRYPTGWALTFPKNLRGHLLPIPCQVGSGASSRPRTHDSQPATTGGAPPHSERCRAAMDGLLPNEGARTPRGGAWGGTGSPVDLKNRVAEDAAIDFLRPTSISSAVGQVPSCRRRSAAEPSVGGGHYTRAHNGRANTRARARKSAPGIC